jgi:hypothetical protein
MTVCESWSVTPTQNIPIGFNLLLYGDIANIPSLKNQKIQGTNILRDAPKAKLVAMTRLFELALRKASIPSIVINEPIHVFIRSAYRPRRYDTDNVITTVKDWLEPRLIRQRDRGWGVGIVANDYDVNAYATRKKKGSAGAEITEIMIRKDSYIEKYLELFLKGFYDGDGKEG